MRGLAALLLALALAAPALAEFDCFDCACTASFGCRHPNCPCARPMDNTRVDELLAHAGRILELAFGEQMTLERPVSGLAVARSEIPGKDGAIMGFYQGGEIFVARELTPAQTLAVVAHEYAHAWQAQHHGRFGEVSPSFGEGFAEWAAYHVLRRAGYHGEADLIRENADPVYGDGVRIFLMMEDLHGPDVVLRTARTWLDFGG